MPALATHVCTLATRVCALAAHACACDKRENWYALPCREHPPRLLMCSPAHLHRAQAGACLARHPGCNAERSEDVRGMLPG